jgi:hypothetical protein
LYVEETIIHPKEKCNYAENKQVHICNTINNDYHRNAHNFEYYNSKPSLADCIFYTRNIKQISNNQFKNELKELPIK